MRNTLKRMVISLLFGLILGSVLVCAAEKVEQPESCTKCGMDRTAFAHSRMLVVYEDGTSVGTCSLHCTATEMKGASDKKIQSIKVADYTTKKLIDAKSATWVIGGRKKGVMTPVAKWAFAGKQDAEAFVRENGGSLATFDEALKKAEAEDMGHQGHMGHKM